MNATTTSEAPVKVVFRKFHGGDVVALFPEIPADSFYGHCLSYQHIGQHSAASVDLIHCTAPASPEDYAGLKAELDERVGYVLEVRKKITAAMDAARRVAWNELHAAPVSQENPEQEQQAGEAVETPAMSPAVAFFYNHAGYSYDPATQTPAEGRLECAQALAKAEAWGGEHGMEFTWGIEGNDSREWSDDELETPTWQCIAEIGDLTVASVGGVDFGDSEPSGPHKRVTEAELAAEAMAVHAPAPAPADALTPALHAPVATLRDAVAFLAALAENGKTWHPDESAADALRPDGRLPLFFHADARMSECLALDWPEFIGDVCGACLLLSPEGNSTAADLAAFTAWREAGCPAPRPQYTPAIGEKVLFTYPNYGTPVGYPEHVAHSGQTVEVIRELDGTECDREETGSMFEIRAADGWQGVVFADELSPVGQ